MNFINSLRRRKNFSVASKQIEFFLLFIALPVLVILTLFAFFFRYRIVEITKNQKEVILQQYASGIDVELQSISITASSLIHNTTLMNRSRALMDAKTAEQRYFISSEIEKVFQTYFILLRHLAGFYLIFENEDAPFISRNYAGIILSNEEIEAYTAMADNNSGVILIPDVLNFSYGQKSGWYIASLVVCPSGEDTGIRSLIVSFVINPLQNFVRWNSSSEISSRPSSDYFISGRNGKILASGDTSLIGEEIAGIVKNYGKSRIIIEAPVESSGWTLVEAVEVRSLTRSIDTILYILYFAMIVIVLFFIRYNTFFFARILNPLRLMIVKMESVGNGDFSVRAESSNFIELNKISESFNYMVEKISMLTEAIKEEHRERVKTEIEALRYQLNPHFLCNTMNAIRMMAIITKNDAIKKMSTALMTITEDTLAGEDMVCSLKHELHILDSYVYIMQVRYGNTFELIKDVDNSLLDTGVPSMILQPLVENAILHGFHELSGPCAIVVSAAIKEDSLIISVRDNGIGMDAQKLADIFNDHRVDKGLSRIGLYNIRRRIILSYGSCYGVEAASYPGEGTVVTLKLPILRPIRHESRISDRNSV